MLLGMVLGALQNLLLDSRLFVVVQSSLRFDAL